MASRRCRSLKPRAAKSGLSDTEIAIAGWVLASSATTESLPSAIGSGTSSVHLVRRPGTRLLPRQATRGRDPRSRIRLKRALAPIRRARSILDECTFSEVRVPQLVDLEERTARIAPRWFHVTSGRAGFGDSVRFAQGPRGAGGRSVPHTVLPKPPTASGTC